MTRLAAVSPLKLAEAVVTDVVVEVVCADVEVEDVVVVAAVEAVSAAEVHADKVNIAPRKMTRPVRFFAWNLFVF